MQSIDETAGRFMLDHGNAVTMRSMEIEKHEAIGQRGEACIIVLRNITLPNGQTEPAYSLATGERLRPTGVDGEFETLSGNRSFRLRRVPTARPDESEPSRLD